MKILLPVCLMLCFFCGCKKSDETLSPIVVSIDGLPVSSDPAKLSGTSITGTDITQNNTVVLNSVSTDNGTFSTAIVYPGDQVTFVYYLSNSVGNSTGNSATFSCFFKGEKIGSSSVLLGDVNKYSFTVSVP